MPISNTEKVSKEFAESAGEPPPQGFSQLMDLLHDVTITAAKYLSYSKWSLEWQESFDQPREKVLCH